MDDAEAADPITGSRRARLWGNRPGKVNQSRKQNMTFSSEADTGPREENAPEQGSTASFRI
jgi:hypothetical protein